VVPELPEVETIRAALDPLLRGRTVVAARAHPSPKFSGAPDAVGHRVAAVRRRGKYLLADLVPVDGSPARRELVVHLGMTGQLGPDLARDDPYTRAWWALDDGTHLTYRDVRRFGRIAVVEAGDHAGLPTLAALGPEPLGPDFTAVGLWRDLARRRARVKTQLLSQRVVAGVGNIYADEALWRARIHPGSRRVGRERAAALHAAVREVLAAGIANGGTTLRDYRTLTGEAGRNQLALACYGRAGQRCLRCGTALRWAILDARGTTWCPTCQRP
jgi:formamidopyrimidine-DNA glycosylase